MDPLEKLIHSNCKPTGTLQSYLLNRTWNILTWVIKVNENTNMNSALQGTLAGLVIPLHFSERE